MSWAKGSRHPAAGQNAYNPTQPPMVPPLMPINPHPNTHQHPPFNYQYQPGPGEQIPQQQQQQYWQPHHQDPPNPSNAYSQVYATQSFQPQNGNDYYNQYQNQNYQNQPPQYNQMQMQDQSNEGDPWNWGWEDNASAASAGNTSTSGTAVNSNAIITTNSNAVVTGTKAPKPYMNSLSDSFTNSDSWNWNTDTAQALQPDTSQAMQPDTSEDVTPVTDTPIVDDVNQEIAIGVQALTLDGNRENLTPVQPPPPPTALPLTDAAENPFKRAGPISRANLATPPVTTSLSSPSAVTKVVRTFGSYEPANLEIAPDNSEQPDLSPPLNFRSVDNLEIIPTNDRNEYLQTGHLSESDYSENFQNIEQPRSPPPGLSRMVPGQLTDSENYMDRQVDGQNTENDLSNSTNNESYEVFPEQRRPIGLDRMVPGQSSGYRAAQQSQRFVTGLEHEAPAEVREQNVDGSDYTDNQPDVQGQSTPAEPAAQREIEMEGENLQDLSAISSVAEPKPSSSTWIDSGSDKARKPDFKILKYANTSEESEREKPAKKEKDRRSTKDKDGRYSREVDDRKSVRRDDKDSDKANRDRKSKDKRDREYLDDRTEGDRRYNRRSTRDRRYETEDTDYYSDRERDARRLREGSGKPPFHPDDRDRRYRDEKDRYKTKDDRDRRYKDHYRDDYESERDRRHRDRDGGRDRRYRDDDRSSRYGTLERERNNRSSLKKDRGNRGEPHSSPSRPSSTNREKEEDPEKTLSSLGHPERPRERDRPSERDRRRERDRRTVDRDRDPRRDRGDRDRDRDRRDRGERHYGGGYYGHYQNQYAYQQQQYEYYENLRLTNPAAYMEIYRNYYGGYSSMPAFSQEQQQADDRGSVHSGMSSNGANKNRSMVDGAGYFYQYRPIDRSLVGRRDDGPFDRAPSVRTDHSGSRDFNTDMSLQLEVQSDTNAGTIQSDRQTPMKFPTAHIKGSLCSTHLVAISPTYPVDGQPAMIEILDLNVLLADDPTRCELTDYPGPLIKDTTHKKTVIEFCESRIRSAMDGVHSSFGGRPVYQHQMSTVSNSSSGSPAQQDLASFVLMWELLILLLRQNGRVVGADIAELLMKNKRNFEHKSSVNQRNQHLPASNSRRNSGVSSSATSRSDQQLQSEETDHLNPNSERTGDDTGSPADGEVNDSSLGQETSQGSLSRNRRVSRDKVKGPPALTQPEAIEKFREYLIFGNVKQGLEFAMSYGGVLWAHALQLAPSLDARSRAAVAARFVASLPPSDPLATLHALLSSPPRQPRVITSVSDERWGDWRPHLAIILANSSQRRDLDKKAILTLGDTLLTRGSLLAAHFCYLMAEVDFGRSRATPFFKPTEPQQPSSRLVLLGMDVSRAESSYAATNEGIFMTEIYEYACSLSSDNFTLWEFQPFKYLLALRMTDYGLYEKALSYTEIITSAIVSNPAFYLYPFANSVLQLADRLKFSDPDLAVGQLTDGSASPYSTDQPWISQLRQVVSELMVGQGHATSLPVAMIPNATQPPPQEIYKEERKNSQGYEGQSWNAQPSFAEAPAPQYFNPNEYQNQNHAAQPEQQSQFYQQHQDAQPEIAAEAPSMYNPNNVPASYGQAQQENSFVTESNSYGGDPYWGRDTNQMGYGYNEPEREAESPDKTEQTETSAGDPYALAQPMPTISMPNASGPAKQSIFDDEYREDRRRGRENEMRNSTSSQQTSQSSKDKKNDSSSAKSGNPGWFGGIFTKLSLKPKNQMILPDDKNPSIVWDEDKQRWRDKDAGDEATSAPLAPPPSMPLPSFNQHSLPTGAPSISASINSPVMPAGIPSPGSNVFKMQKSRHIKKAYVDVFNPGGASTANSPPPPSLQSQVPPPPQNMFVPGQDGMNTGQMAPMYDQSNY